MNQVLLSSIRAHTGRLVATGIAVTLAVAFVVATLLLSSSYTQTMADGLTAQMAQADVQIQVSNDAVDEDEVNDQLETALKGLKGMEQVSAADIQEFSAAPVRAGARRANARVEPLLSRGNRWQVLAAGTWPDAQGEAAIDEESATTLGVKTGDSVSVRALGGQDSAVDLSIVGITSGSNQGFVAGTPTLLTTRATFESLGLPYATEGILVSGSGNLTPQALADLIRERVDVGSDLLVLTRDEAVEQQVAQLSGSSTLLTSVMLFFGLVSLLVSGFVIANTFRVLVAQRTAELALLRCVGASTAQVYRLIVLEAACVGLLFSAAGAGLGTGAAAVLVWLSRSDGFAMPLSSLAVPPLLVVGAVVCGTLVTMVFAIGPARNATRVRPLAALRPLEAAGGGNGSIAAASAGALLLVGAATMVHAAGAGAIGLAVAGGVVSAAGVVLGAATLLPALAKRLGWLVSPVSASTQLAVASVDRSRRRTAATGAALIVGVTLLALLTTSVTSVRESVVAQIDKKRPIDLIAQVAPGQSVHPQTVSAIKSLPEVAASSEVSAAQVELGTASDAWQRYTATGWDQESVSKVAHWPVDTPRAGSVHVNPGDPAASHAGGQVGLRGPDGQARVLVVVDEVVPAGTLRLSAFDLETLVHDPGTSSVLLKLEGQTSAAKVQAVMTSILSLDEDLNVYGGAQERVLYNQILDTMMMVVLALLAVALIIALVGIGNTAALSVIERRRECATLRAVGLSRSQLVTMICTEAVLVAVVSAVIGLVAGVMFGWAGLATLEKTASKIDLTLHVPWAQLAMILLGAAVAGTLAAAVPAYTASRRSPVEDLAAA